MTDWKFTKTKLNDKELDQEISFFNGEYDSEYLAIKIPFINKYVNLRALDKQFVEEFSDLDFEAIQAELKELSASGNKVSDLEI